MKVLTAPPDLEIKTPSGSYDDVAAEYYDPVRHPTCANFREASDYLLDQWWAEYQIGESAIFEVGPGRSAAAEQMLKRGAHLNQLTLVDSSSAMLAYSGKWRAYGSHLIMGDST